MAHKPMPWWFPFVAVPLFPLAAAILLVAVVVFAVLICVCEMIDMMAVLCGLETPEWIKGFTVT